MLAPLALQNLLNLPVLIKVFAHIDPFKMKRNLVCKSHRWLWKCQPAFYTKRREESPEFTAESEALGVALLLFGSWSMCWLLQPSETSLVSLQGCPHLGVWVSRVNRGLWIWYLVICPIAVPNPAGQQSITHKWIRNLVKWTNWGWRFCRELKVHLDMLPALTLVHLGSETEGLGAQDWGKCPCGEADTII